MSSASSGWTSSSTLAPSLNGYAMLPSITKPECEQSIELAGKSLHDQKIRIKNYSLASSQRDLICKFCAKPFDENPFGFGQTPTQICSRIE